MLHRVENNVRKYSVTDTVGDGASSCTANTYCAPDPEPSTLHTVLFSHAVRKILLLLSFIDEETEMREDEAVPHSS